MAKRKQPKSELKNLTLKPQRVRYRDDKGKLVKPESLDGTRRVKFETWRYSPGTKKWNKIDFGKRWEPRYVYRKKLMSKKQELILLQNRYSKHKIKVKMIKGKIYAETASP